MRRLPGNRWTRSSATRRALSKTLRPMTPARMGALAPDELEKWQLRMRPGPWESGDADVGDVGEVTERSVGPAERRCGVRVLAFESCARGSIVHVHIARSQRDDRGDWRGL